MTERFDAFSRRHIGPRPADLDTMLRTVGAKSLDALVDQVVPAAIRRDRPLRSPRRAVRARLSRGARQDRSKEQRGPVVHRPGLLGHDHAARHPAKPAGEPWLVYALYALPGRDRPGPPRIAAQLSDGRARSDRDGSGQRLAAGRADGCRRGDDPHAPRPAEEWRRARHPAGVLPHLAADPRRAGVAGSAARADGESRGPERHPVRRFGVRAHPAVPGRVRRGQRYPLHHRAGARGGRAGGRRHGPARPHPAHAAGRAGGRRRVRQLAAFWRPPGLRWPSRGLLRHPGGARPADARPDHRRLGGFERAARIPDGPPDARAAHPP